MECEQKCRCQSCLLQIMCEILATMEYDAFYPEDFQEIGRIALNFDRKFQGEYPIVSDNNRKRAEKLMEPFQMKILPQT